MSEFQTVFTQALSGAITEVLASLGKHWVALSLAILIAALSTVFIDAEKLKHKILDKPKVSILAAVLFGALTPLCACGTMAVMLGMLTTALPWGAVMAFLTSSPLMSPEGFVMLSGVIGMKFAVGLTIASIILGLVSGYLTHLIEQRSNFLEPAGHARDARRRLPAHTLQRRRDRQQPPRHPRVVLSSGHAP